MPPNVLSPPTRITLSKKRPAATLHTKGKTIQIHAYKKKENENKFDLVITLEVPEGTTIGTVVHELANACSSDVNKTVVRDMSLPSLDPRGGLAAVEWEADDVHNRLYEDQNVWLQPRQKGG